MSRVARFQIAADHPALPGHFPGRPIVPGVVLLSEVLEAVLADAELAALVGIAPRIGAVKFLAPVGPGAMLEVRFEPTATSVRFEVAQEARAVASGHFERVAASAD